jgi:hypothetical protein
MSGLVGQQTATDSIVCVVMEFCIRKGGGKGEGRRRGRDRVCMDVVGWEVRLLFMFGKLRLLNHILG